MARYTLEAAKEMGNFMVLSFIEKCERTAKENWTPVQCEMLSRLFDTVTAQGGENDKKEEN